MTTLAVRSGLRVHTRAIPDPGRLIDLLPEPTEALCWVRDGAGLVGWGELARFDCAWEHRFADADVWWRSLASRLEVRDEVGLPGTGPVAFASFAFGSQPGWSVLVVPRVVIGRRDGISWITEFTDGERGSVVDLPVTRVRSAQSVRYADGRLPVSRWRTSVAEAVRRLRAGDLDKVALAHDLIALSDTSLDPRYLLNGLAARYPSCWSFAVDGLVGATPELLLQRSGAEVTSRVLAGTIWPGEAAEHELGARLLGSAKDREEHRLAVDSLGAALRPLCDDLELPAVPSVVRLHNVLHLASDVRGHLRGRAGGLGLEGPSPDVVRPGTDGPPSLLRLAEAVHPTAAVGGTPRDAALRLIAELEGMDRGRYAGPVGWVDAAGDGELGVALRCAHISGRTARLFAGCGVMACSDPDNEVREAAAKLVAMREALEGIS